MSIPATSTIKPYARADAAQVQFVQANGTTSSGVASDAPPLPPSPITGASPSLVDGLQSPFDDIDGALPRNIEGASRTPVADPARRGTAAIAVMPPRADIRQVVAAIDHAASNRATVVNISQDTVAAAEEDLDVFRASLRHNPNVVVILPAGNDGRAVGARPFELAAIEEPNLVKVAAARADGSIAPTSNYHPQLVQFAMHVGVNDPSLSDAAPAFANLIAKVRLLAPQLSPAEAIAIVARASRRDDDIANRVRYGIPDGDRALRLAVQSAPTK